MDRQKKIKRFRELTKKQFFKRKEDLNASWEECCRISIIPEFILEEYIEELKIDLICTHQVLSEDFIRKFKSSLDWKLITKYQIVSESFIEEMSDHIDWFTLLHSRELSRDFLLKHEERFENWIQNWYKQEKLKGSIVSMEDWFSSSSESAIHKQFLLRNLTKMEHICFWDSHYEKLSSEELDEILTNFKND